MPAESWPLPPSITIRSGKGREALVALGVVRRAVGLLEQASRAPPEDLLDRGEVIAGARLARARSAPRILNRR